MEETNKYDSDKNKTESIDVPSNAPLQALIVEDNPTVSQFLDKILLRHLSPIEITHA